MINFDRSVPDENNWYPNTNLTGRNLTREHSDKELFAGDAGCADNVIGE